MDISIIIINYNTKALLINCLRSIIEFTENISYEIIVVDNASKDDSVEQVEKHFPEVKIIKLSQNIGFGNANNIAAKEAKGEFLFLINSDITFIENSCEKFLRFYNNNHQELRIGSLGCLLLDINKKINGAGSKFPNVSSIIKNKLRFLPFYNKFFPREKEENYWHINREYFEVDYVMGADFFIKKELFLKMGGFDSYYFMYFEETDLSLKLVENNYKNYIYNETKIIHSDILSPEEIKPRVVTSDKLRNIIHRSEIYYVKKNYKKNYILYLVIDIFILPFIFLSKNYTFKENFNYIKNTFKCY